MINNGRNRSRKGQMPMAMIAVALLISGSFFCIVTKNIEESTRNSESLSNEIDALDEEMDRTIMQIEADLGNIVSNLSDVPGSVSDGTTTESHNLLDISRTFDKEYREMFDTKYPAFNRGVTADVISHDIWLTIESMRLGTEGSGINDTKSTFLRAIGTVTIEFSTESTGTLKTFEVSADATSCLPLVIESATEFELSIEGANSALAQMVDYQLSALVQSRILNGYGAMNIGGSKSVEELITVRDVQKAVRNALDIIETMKFRCNGSGNESFLGMSQIDIAEYFVAEDGVVKFDLGAFYGQAIYSKIDEYALSWMEYLGTDLVFEAIDGLNDFSRDIAKGVVKFILNKDIDKDKAIDLISKCMQEVGAVNDLKIIAPGTVEITVPDLEFTVDVDEESVTVFVEGWTEKYQLPEKNVLDWEGWGKFYENYRHDRNALLESLKGVLKSIAMNIEDSCIVELPIDCYDDENYAETIKSMLHSAIQDCNAIFEENVRKESGSCEFTDPFMSTAYDCIKRNAYAIFDLPEVTDDIRYAFMTSCNNKVSEYKELSEYRTKVIEEMYLKSNINSAFLTYMKIIDDQVMKLESMNRAIHDNSNIIIECLAFAIGKVLEATIIGNIVKDQMDDLADRIIESVESEPIFDVMELPEEESFELTDGLSGKYVESLSIVDETDLRIDLVSPLHNDSKNIHYIGFKNWGKVVFSATYDVKVSGKIDYTITSSNEITGSVDSYDSIYYGSSDIDFFLEIPCISGWELAGVHYKKSNTLLNDVWTKVFEIIQPILDDLMRIFRAIKDLENICSNIMLEFGNRINDMLTMVYEIVTIPLEILQNMVATYLQDLLRNIGLESMCLALDGQKITFRVFDAEITIETDLRTAFKSTKEIVKVTISKEVMGISTTAFCQIGKKGDDSYKVLAGGSAEGDDWKFSVDLDPLLSSRPYYVSISGNVRGIEYSGTLPEHVEYKKLEVAISDVPGIGDLLSNIPTPIPGVSCSIDAGAYLKCNLPIKDGLVINEVELNPAGNDAGNEWVELYNNSDKVIDLTGYVLSPESGGQKAYTIEDEVIGIKEHLIIEFPKQTLNNGPSKGLKGERVTLYNTYGEVVDYTDWLTDSENNEFTNQRSTDAYVDWGFNKRSPGGSNGENFAMPKLSTATLVDYMIDIVPEVLTEMGGKITDTEQMMEFVETVMAEMLERIIDTIANGIVEAYLFIDLAFKDYTGSLGLGMKVMLGLDSEIVGDTLRYIASMIPMIGEHINNPMGMTMERIMMDDIYFRIVTYMGISAPKFMKLPGDTPEINAGLSLKFNLSAISSVFRPDGEEKGWRAEAGLVLEDVPVGGIPPQFKAKEYYDHDLWLIRMSFSKAAYDEGA